MNCPLCGGVSIYRFTKHEVPIRDCRACGHRFAEVPANPAHVETIYGDDYFFGGGAGYTDYLGEAELLRSRGRSYARRMRPWMNPGRILDVGAAAGYFLQGWIESGWQGMGIEPNRRMATYAREQLKIPVEVGDLESVTSEEPFDLVCFSQVIAHFLDPIKALRKAAALTKRSGHWLIETWDCGSLMARLTGQGWHEYSPPSVLHWFTRASLRALVRRMGFEPIAWGRTAKWIQIGHARALLAHSSGSSLPAKIIGAMLGLLPQRRALPYPSEDLFWMLCRKRGE